MRYKPGQVALSKMNREIRRLFAASGHEVTRLIRVSFGMWTHDERERASLKVNSLPADTPDVVIYFFHKHDRYVQCEIAETHIPDTFAIVVTEADGTVRSHFVEGSLETRRRWLQLESDLRAAGWHGPHGRE